MSGSLAKEYNSSSHKGAQFLTPSLANAVYFYLSHNTIKPALSIGYICLSYLSAKSVA